MRILLAVSGGIDSMYMAIRASELYPEALFAVAHCNFSLRGDESDGDEAFVREWCEKHNMDCFTIRFDTRDYAKKHSISIEMAARELRYAWFDKLCCEQGFDAVAVAHNANDNAETLILNMLRGTGGKGIRGMGEHGRLLRPLLGTTREDIKSWMKAQGQTWREDSSNAESDCRRNIIRNQIFPLFATINPSYIRTLNADMQRFAQLDDIAEDYFADAAADLHCEQGFVLLGDLLKNKHWKYVLWRMLEPRGITQDEFNSLVECVESGRQLAGKRFGPVLGGSGKLVFGESTVCPKLQWEIVPRTGIASLIQPRGVLIADADKLQWPLKIRHWQDGDWMQPFGMRGRKKLSDLFTDLKWSLFQKQEALVLELDGQHVAALLCQRIDEAVKVDDDTQRVLRMWLE